jgi:hypothetical protein
MDGLVFYHDMSNTQKSFKGAPTTNLLPTPLTIASTWTKEGGFGTVTDNVGYAPDDTQTSTQCVFTGGYLYYTLTLTPGVTYTFSCYVKGSAQTSRGIGLWSYAVGGIVAASSQAINADTWTRVSVTYTVASGASSFAIMLAGYPSNIFQGTIEVWHPQLEVNSFASPFVNGTRSNTQAIVDLTGRNTITANSLTYASDGTFSFNGSSNHIVVSNGMNALIGTDSVTFSAWIYRTSAPAYWSGIIANKVNVANGICLLVNPDSKIFWQYDGGTSGVYAISGGATLAINTWYNIVGVYDNVGLKTYLNGVLNESASDPGKFISSTGNMDITIGAQDTGPGGPFPGRIAQCLVYNRALTATEIAENFNAHRSRYGI